VAEGAGRGGLPGSHSARFSSDRRPQPRAGRRAGARGHAVDRPQDTFRVRTLQHREQRRTCWTRRGGSIPTRRPSDRPPAVRRHRDANAPARRLPVGHTRQVHATETPPIRPEEGGPQSAVVFKTTVLLPLDHPSAPKCRPNSRLLLETRRSTRPCHRKCHDCGVSRRHSGSVLSVVEK
jgi:hypothetical protein